MTEIDHSTMAAYLMNPDFHIRRLELPISESSEHDFELAQIERRRKSSLRILNTVFFVIFAIVAIISLIEFFLMKNYL